MFSFNLALPNENSFVFNTPGIFPFVKPYGIQFIHMICIGGGGAGGAGATLASGSTGGGGGGGAAGITTGIFPADFLPDTVYVSVGAGGAGGIGAGAAGELSAIYLLNQISTTTNGILLSAPGGNGGGTTTTSAGGAAGTLVSAATITSMPAASIGIFTSMDGPAGALGGSEVTAPAAGVGSSVIALASSIVCGGAGGGSLGASNFRFSGGSVAATTNASGNINLPTISAGTSSTPAQAQNGTFIFAPHFVSLGGAGGAGDTTIIKPGGIGGMGSGGGGGGAGRTGFGSGNGGNGGNGIVIISCW